MKAILLLCIAALFSTHIFAQSLESDRLALVAIYNQADGANWLTNWVIPGNTGDNPCGWDGVTCEGGRVTRLDLKGLGVQGTLPAEVGNLTALTYLDLTGVGLWYGVLTGDLPATITNLTNLEYLNLAEHTFSIGSLGVIGSMTNLKGIAITPGGDVPASFTNLANLETLYLGSDDPMGGYANFSFPAFLSSLPKLKELHLHGGVNGELPAAVGNFSNLEVLDLSINGFLNNLPPQIGNLSKLKRLYISRYDGIGDFAFLSSLLNLEELELHDNYFSGTLPTDIDNLTKLRKIIIESSTFHGPIPSGVGNLPELTELRLRHNSFIGPIPNLSNIPVSGVVDLADNMFTFEGMESNITRLDQYSPQAQIMIKEQILPGYPAARLSVQAGGTQANNTYKWYRDNVLWVTNVGNNLLDMSDYATYRVEVTNSVVTGLKLVSNNYIFSRMPVTLVSFEAKSENNQTRLTWKTTSETDNKGFEIERSADARTFETIGFVDGNGDTQDDKTYHFADLNPFAMSYYRLKQLDYDGKFEYSKVIVVKGDGAVVKVYPNPAQDYLTVSGIGQKQPLSIVDQTGRLVLKGLVTDKEQVNISGLRTGSYIVKVGGEQSVLLIHR